MITSRLVVVGQALTEEERAALGEEEEERVFSGTVSTMVKAAAEDRVRGVHWLLLVGSVLAGLLVLALLSGLLYKVRERDDGGGNQRFGCHD